jgi:hypothetical protein
MSYGQSTYVIISGQKRPRLDASDGEVTGEGEGIEEEPEEATANSADPSVAKRNKRRQDTRTRDKLKKRTDTERSAPIAEDFRISMKMSHRYEGVIAHLHPNRPRASVLLQGTTLMGFCVIPPGRTCTLGESVPVRMALPDAAYTSGTALCLELV